MIGPELFMAATYFAQDLLLFYPITKYGGVLLLLLFILHVRIVLYVLHDKIVIL